MADHVETYVNEMKELWPHAFGPQEEYTPKYLDFMKDSEVVRPPFPKCFTRDVKQYKNPIFGSQSFNEFFIRGCYETQFFKTRPDDVFVASFPKTGTTWMEEIAYLVSHNFEFEKAKSNLIMFRVPYIDVPRTSRAEIDEMPGPRILQTHMQFPNLPPSIKETNAKVIYVTRNPKDTIVSIYNFYKMINVFYFDGTFKEFFKNFLKGFVFYGPFPVHVKTYWEHRNDANILFVTYEEMKKDLGKVIRKVADYLGKPYTDEIIEKVVEHCSFKEMSKNPMSNRVELEQSGVTNKDAPSFMRKGIVGDWKNNFDDEMNKEFDEWMEENFSDTDFKFDFEI